MNIQVFKILRLFLALVLSLASYAAKPAERTVCATFDVRYFTLLLDSLEQDLYTIDTSFLSVTDSSRLPAIDSSATAIDSLPLRRVSSLEAPIFSKGRDSIIYDFTGTSRIIYYYGDVTVNYTNLEMKADYMAYNVDTRVVFATGTRDTTGAWVGRPIMKEGGKEYEMDTVYYNFESRKARIKHVITAEGDAFLHGDIIKKMPDNSINIKHGKYTTCDEEHPHFYLRLTQAKVMPKPNSKTVFGPSYLVIEDVPVYMLGLPFGFIPKRNDRAGGFLFPTFSEEASRGFSITNIGWYFVFGEYFDLALTADYFTLGSYAVRANSRYKKMYKFDGSFSLNTSRTVVAPDFNASDQFSIAWNHRQDPKANPEIALSASVNYMSSSYRRYNSLNNPQNALQSSANSSISWQRRWEGSPFNLSINLTHSQNMQDSTYSLTLPNLTFTMSTIYPFKRKRKVGEEKFYEKFSLGYSTGFDNKIRFKESEFSSMDFLATMENGMKHNFTVGLPSFNVFKFINISPSINYGMTMFFRGMKKEFNDSTQQLQDVKSKSFSEFHMAHSASFGVSANTIIYGMFPFGKKSYIQAIRHVLKPSVSLSFSPDARHFWDKNGYRTLYYVDKNNMSRSVEYNAYSGIFSAPGTGQSASLGFTLGNNIEMKCLSKKDTVNGTKKIKIIDNLNFSGSYNFLADSMNLSNINASLSTNLLGIGISANAVFDPYTIRNGQRINKFSIEDGEGLARMTSFNFSFGHQFQGGANGIKNNPTTLEGIHRYDTETGQYLYTEYRFYDDFKAPWSLGFNFSFSYNPMYVRKASNEWIKQSKYILSLNFNGQIKLTEDLNISAQSGFDFKQMELTTTTMSMQYDMHCFQFSVQWTPFGQYRSWSFYFSAKSSMLADLLKYDKKTNYYGRY